MVWMHVHVLTCFNRVFIICMFITTSNIVKLTELWHAVRDVHLCKCGIVITLCLDMWCIVFLCMLFKFVCTI